jgi:hypothetical protein
MPNAVVVCCPLSSFALVVHRLILRAVVICRLCCPPLSLSTLAAIACSLHPPQPPPLLSATTVGIRRTIFCRHSHHRHSAVSAVSCRPLLSFPIIVRCPILHAVVVLHCRCPPLPLLSATTVFHTTAIITTHCLRHLSPPALVLPHHSLPPNLTCRCCLPPSSSAVAIPLLVLPPTFRC